MDAIRRLWPLSDTSKLANPFKQAEDYKQDMKMEIIVQTIDQGRMPHGSKGDVIQNSREETYEGHRCSDCSETRPFK
ncbi:hypothetical protein COLO4_07695 [Corchorus olitorius]|uniref:Uncharacterized protein n=1 Tax=Corchorus olitorius TaxID=93759 RepID=A0A1R3KIW0_9ROSI|nr:hypothetical protein COLO4_07695 [Corchorus olitorius]